MRANLQWRCTSRVVAYQVKRFPANASAGNLKKTDVSPRNILSVSHNVPFIHSKVRTHGRIRAGRPANHNELPRSEFVHSFPSVLSAADFEFSATSPPRSAVPNPSLRSIVLRPL